MKTRHIHSRYMKTNLIFIIFMLLLILGILVMKVSAQVMVSHGQVNEPRQFYYDPNFPTQGRFNAGLITTYTGIAPPPALVGDATYGVSNKFSFGVIAGTTGALALSGIKLNAELFQKRDFRIMYRMIILYYPTRNGKFLFDREVKNIMAWMLSMGAIDAEWKTKKGIRYAVGAGMLETNCIAGLKKWLGNMSEEKNLPFEIFNTIQGSVSVPVSKKLTLRPEVICVMKGSNFVERGKFKVFPVNPYLKLIYDF